MYLPVGFQRKLLPDTFASEEGFPFRMLILRQVAEAGGWLGQSEAVPQLAACVLRGRTMKLMRLFFWFLDCLFGQWQAGREDRQIAKEFGDTAPCPTCGRENSVRARVCPRCEERLSG